MKDRMTRTIGGESGLKRLRHEGPKEVFLYSHHFVNSIPKSNLHLNLYGCDDLEERFHSEMIFQLRLPGTTGSDQNDVEQHCRSG